VDAEKLFILGLRGYYRDKHNATINIDDNGTQGLFINLGGKQGSATYGFENIVTNG